MKNKSAEQTRFEKREYMLKWNAQRKNLPYEECTWEEGAALLDLAEDRCMICGQPENGRALSIDHSHVSGKVRGYLCNGCNNGLGYFNDDPEALERAAEYLRLTVEGYGGLTRYFLDTRPPAKTE